MQSYSITINPTNLFNKRPFSFNKKKYSHNYEHKKAENYVYFRTITT